ncbi:centrosomal protein of 89 kDa-like isoform X2 [Lethenteron reissneri]|uniref:centrosomal protein of 89 kDa-like isoform X2 n=1 Tax=Lethenteron reissneri TaxID=7753 RepID=UPI002AB6A6C8|nr:centrosomal protein of 89 kDa-like isoform X2 [Lethenteron reissneri]
MARNKDKWSYRHIAAGMVPAVTIAPRPAVPLTPPPHTQEPSQEHPKSALAAAVLVSSLAGRVHAIPTRNLPLSRPSSFSVSDTNSFRSGILELHHERANGGGDCMGNGRLPLAEVAYEPMYESCTERHDSAHSLTEDGCSSDVLGEDEEEEEEGEEEEQAESLTFGKDYEQKTKYARGDCETKKPYSLLKTKTVEGAPLGESSDLTDVTSLDETARLSSPRPPKLCTPSDAEWSRLGRRPKIFSGEDKEAVCLSVSNRPMPHFSQSSNRERMPASRSQSLRVKGEKSTDQASKRNPTLAMFNELKSRLDVLAAENRSLTRQLRVAGDHNQSLAAHNGTLLSENQSLARERQQEQTDELAELRREAQELVDENDELKATIHRLSTELSRMQAERGPRLRNKGTQTGVIPMSGSTPPLSTDTRRLSPLLAAYEERLVEKDDIVRECKEALQTLKEQMNVVAKENEQLHQELVTSKAAAGKEWKLVQEQGRLVLEENQVLLQQLDLQKAKLKDSQGAHKQEVSKLMKRLERMEAQKREALDQLTDARVALGSLQERHRQLQEAEEVKVGREEHLAAISDLQRRAQEQHDHSCTQLQGLREQLAACQEDKRVAVQDKCRLEARLSVLDSQLEAAKKTTRRYQRGMATLKQKLEESMGKENLASRYLNNVLGLAEQVVKERDELQLLTETLQLEKEGVLNRVLEGNAQLVKLHDKVKVYRARAARAIAEVAGRSQDAQAGWAGRSERYDGEIRHLRQMLSDKQGAVETLAGEKRQVEAQLEIVWESTSRENERMRRTLRETLTTSAGSPGHRVGAADPSGTVGRRDADLAGAGDNRCLTYYDLDTSRSNGAACHTGGPTQSLAMELARLHCSASGILSSSAGEGSRLSAA